MERLRLILNEDNSPLVTKRVSPFENVGFLVDRSCLEHPKEWLIHNAGSFKYNGRSIAIVENGNLKKVSKIPHTIAEGTYVVDSVSWKHLNADDFRRQSTTVRSSTGEFDVALLEFRFTGEPHLVIPKANKHGKPILSVLPSVKESIKQTIRENPEMGSKSLMTKFTGDTKQKAAVEMPVSTEQVCTLLPHTQEHALICNTAYFCNWLGSFVYKCKHQFMQV